ncbi:MAG: HAMP domain-containing histidine kinase [Oscillospiraceae bacterium]|nr:HAMP domain-containing histidine kinase [Oscillospiraceae bacterium]
MNNKSIASRFFTSISILIMISISLLGATFMAFANRYFESDRLNILNVCVESVEDNIGANYGGNISDIKEVERMTENLKLISDTTQSTVMIADLNGKVVTCTDNDDCATEIPKEAISLADSYQETVRVSDIFTRYFQTEYYAVGKAVRDEAGAVTGYIFVASSIGTIRIFTNALLSMFLVSACVMILVSSIVSIAVTSKLIMPLRNISDAAKRFSQGDLSARARVEGDDEVAHLAYTFNNMAAFAENNETSRSNFVANIAHELRTPMTSIKGFVDGIIDGTIPTEKQGDYLSIVSTEIGRLARLTNSMLDMSKLESGEFIMNVANYNIWDTISAVAFAFENRIENAEIQVRGFEPSRVRVAADQDIIHQVVYNIVDNALKFTPHGGYIGFNVTEDKSTGMVTVKVRNSGAGIPKEDLPYLFDRFYKADASRSVHTKGAGIGLYIAKTLVTRSGGDIHVESELGEYTEFVFTVPAAVENKPAPKTKNDGKNQKSKNDKKPKNDKIEKPKGIHLKTPKKK